MSIPAPIGLLRITPVLVMTVSFLPAAEKSSPGEWPHWRGPTGNGVSPDGKPPIEWGESKNLKWKVKIPGGGSASPVVGENRVFVVTAVEVGENASVEGSAPRAGEDGGRRERPGVGRSGGRPGERGGRFGGRSRGRRGPPDTPRRFTLLCLDRESGRTLWERIADETTPHEGHHPSHGFASASPCTDGERVYAHFGSRGLFAYDLDGKLQWKKTDFGSMRTRNGFGEGSSPTIHGDTVLVPWDHEGPSSLSALDRRTGKTLWKVERDEPSCWATPLVVEHGGQTLVIASGENYARAYDFFTGKEIWRCSGQTSRPVASPVAGHGLVFIGSGHRGSFLGAFRLDGREDLEVTGGVAWTLKRSTPDVPSPLLSGRRLYFFSGRSGILSCHDAVTGRPHYSARRIEDISSVYASPVAANGKVYLTSREGTTVVIEDAEELKIVATNRLDEGVDATPAIAGREIFVRGSQHLYCFAH